MSDRSFMLSSWAAPLVATLTFAAALASWKSVESKVPPAMRLPLVKPETFLWVGPGLGPVHLIGEGSAEGVLFTGASRLRYGIELSRVDAAGLGPACIVWGRRLETTASLMAAKDLDNRRILVSLSPNGLAPLDAKLNQEVLREEPPAYDPTASRAEVLRWHAEEMQRLPKLDKAFMFPGATLDPMAEEHGKIRKRQSQWSYGFEDMLRARLQLARYSLVHTVTTWTLQVAWLRHATPRSSDDLFQQTLTDERDALRRQGAEECIRLAKELVAEGREIAFVRMPLDGELRAFEDEQVTADLLASIPEAVGAP